MASLGYAAVFVITATQQVKEHNAMAMSLEL